MRWNTISDRLGIDARTLRKWREMDSFPEGQNLADIQDWALQRAEGSAQAERQGRCRPASYRESGHVSPGNAKGSRSALTIDSASAKSISELKQLEEAKGKSLQNKDVIEKIRAEERALMLERWRGFVEGLHSGVADMGMNRKLKVALNRVIDNAWQLVSVIE